MLIFTLWSSFNTLFIYTTMNYYSKVINLPYKIWFKEILLRKRTLLLIFIIFGSLKSYSNPKVIAPRFYIESIILQCDKRLLDNKVVKIIKQFSGKALGPEDIIDLKKLLTHHFIEEGYITTSISLPEQDLSSRKLILAINIGKVERFETNIKGINMAFKSNLDEYLNLRDIEQGIDQLNNLKSNNIKVKIKPGLKQHYSIIELENSKNTKSWHVVLGVDNQGSKGQGINQQFISINKDNLLNHCDNLLVAARKNMSGENYYRNYSFAFSMPFGYSNLKLNYNRINSKFKYLSNKQSFFDDTKIENAKISIENVIYRDSTTKKTASIAFGRDIYEKKYNNIKLFTGSYKLNVLQLALHNTYKIKNSVANIGFTFKQGLEIDNTKTISGLPNPFFKSYSTDISCTTPTWLRVGIMHPILNVSIHGQFSQDTLYNSEKLTIGGLGSIRGYKEDSFSGDKGFYVRNELIFDLAGWSDKYFKRSQIFFGYDWGGSKNNNESTSTYLTGYAAGIRHSSDRFSLGVTFGVPGSNSLKYKTQNIVSYFNLHLEL